MPAGFRFTTGDKAIADSIAVQYGGEVGLCKSCGQYEVVAAITGELPGDDAGGEAD